MRIGPDAVLVGSGTPQRFGTVSGEPSHVPKVFRAIHGGETAHDLIHESLATATHTRAVALLASAVEGV